MLHIHPILLVIKRLWQKQPVWQKKKFTSCRNKLYIKFTDDKDVIYYVKGVGIVKRRVIYSTQAAKTNSK